METIMGGSAVQETSCLSQNPKDNYFAHKDMQLDSVLRFITFNIPRLESVLRFITGLTSRVKYSSP